jgi:hypothetical protein
VLAAGATAAQRIVGPVGEDVLEVNQGFITREWTWSNATTTTTFTASGPSEQVNALDLQDRTPHCPDCELASSIASVPDDASVLTEISE